MGHEEHRGYPCFPANIIPLERKPDQVNYQIACYSIKDTIKALIRGITTHFVAA